MSGWDWKLDPPDGDEPPEEEPEPVQRWSNFELRYWLSGLSRATVLGILEGKVWGRGNVLLFEGGGE